MKPAHPATAWTALTAAMILPALVVACGSSSPAGSAPSRSPASASASAPATHAPTPPAQPPGSSSPAAAGHVISTRLAYPWNWPNDVTRPGKVTHAYPVPPVPELVRISVGRHPGTGGQPSYERMSFTFTRAFPSYHFAWSGPLIADGSGKVVPVGGDGVLRIVFTVAQAHTADGSRSSITAQPARPVGYQVIRDYAQAGDFEGYVTYGIGVQRAIPHSNPQPLVRAYEVAAVSATGQHEYTVAFDIDVASLGY